MGGIRRQRPLEGASAFASDINAVLRESESEGGLHHSRRVVLDVTNFSRLFWIQIRTNGAF